jgi:hypothetical protein
METEIKIGKLFIMRTSTILLYEQIHVNCRGEAVAKALPLAALDWLNSPLKKAV